MYLLKAFALDQQSNGPTYLALSELSRLKYDQKQYEKAIYYFEQAIPAMEIAKASQEAPTAFSDILSEYAFALKQVGKSEQSKEAQLRAEKLIAQNLRGHSVTDRTPYGSQFVTK